MRFECQVLEVRETGWGTDVVVSVGMEGVSSTTNGVQTIGFRFAVRPEWAEVGRSWSMNVLTEEPANA